MIERNKRKVNVTDRFQYSENLDVFISLLQRARTEVNRRGWSNPKIIIEKNDGDWEYAYVQVVAERDETDSELYVRQLEENHRQELREQREQQELKRLLEKYGNES